MEIKYKLLDLIKLLRITTGFYKFTSGFRLMSNLLTEKEEDYESIKSIKNLARLSPNHFEKKNTHRCYSVIMGKFCEVFGDQQLDDLTADDVMDFFNQVTDRCKPQTKRIR